MRTNRSSPLERNWKFSTRPGEARCWACGLHRPCRGVPCSRRRRPRPPPGQAAKSNSDEATARGLGTRCGVDPPGSLIVPLRWRVRWIFLVVGGADAAQGGVTASHVIPPLMVTTPDARTSCRAWSFQIESGASVGSSSTAGGTPLEPDEHDSDIERDAPAGEVGVIDFGCRAGESPRQSQAASLLRGWMLPTPGRRRLVRCRAKSTPIRAPANPSCIEHANDKGDE